jgi:NADPH:quinone reductase-like Zn-dependent oxidoreductase
MATTSSAWQIRPSPSKSWRDAAALENLYLNNEVPKPTTIPDKSALVRIRAAAINARDVMVIAHDPIYPLTNIPGLSPCADGVGEIAAVGEGSSWKVGHRILIFSFDAEKTGSEELPDLVGLEGKGAGGVQGTLREWGVFVSWLDWVGLIRADMMIERCRSCASTDKLEF